MLSDWLSATYEFRQSIRIADAIDVAVIAILLYSLLIWIRQAASRNVIIGVSLLAALYFFARGLDMYLTLLVFHTAFAVLLVVLVVVFQEEIRRVFERVANWGTFRDLRRPATRGPEVDSLVEASFQLASNRTGALIVLEGREQLSRNIDGGIPLSGRISKPLLYSVFDTSSPGHDGAVVIRRDRIDLFGAHLPISKNHEQIRGRGTRHSAALGLSECSDALIICVSEERGVVSVAESSAIREMKSAADLKGRVSQFLEDKFPMRLDAAWKRVLTRHLWLKILSIVLAASAWFLVAYDVETIQTSFLVPIEYRNVPANSQVAETAPVEALVTLSGSQRAFRLLDRNGLKISVDLSGVKNSTEWISITKENLRLPVNVQLDRVQPAVIQVELER